MNIFYRWLGLGGGMFWVAGAMLTAFMSRWTRVEYILGEWGWVGIFYGWVGMDGGICWVGGVGWTFFMAGG